MVIKINTVLSLILTITCFFGCGKTPSAPIKVTIANDPAGARGGNETQLLCNPSAELDPGSSPLRRLSRSQYINSVRALLGNVPALETVLSNQAVTMTLGTSLSIPSSSEVSAYHDAGLRIAADFVSQAALLQKIIPCSDAVTRRECSKKAITQLTAKAFRSAEVSESVTRFMTLYDLGASVSHSNGIELVIATLLQSPKFLYQVEIGTGEKFGSKAVKLNDYEIASRLAFALWDSAPDDKLLKAAAEGKLQTKEAVAEQITWMMADAKGRDLLRRFLETWTRVDDFALKSKDAVLYPEWNATLKTAIRSQASAFFDHVLTQEGGTLAALLGSKTVMINKDMASYYGTSDSNLNFSATLKNEAYTAGILTLPAILSLNSGINRSSPTNRGKFVRETLLCQHLGTIPADVVNSIDPANKLPTRDAIQQTTASPKCAGCHKLTDPIGFTFENYDAIGRFRTLDSGAAIDASGEIFAAFGIEGKINGVSELAGKLSESQDVKDCVVKQLFRFVRARLEQSSDACSIEQSAAAFRASGEKLDTLPAAIIGHETILYRQPLD